MQHKDIVAIQQLSIAPQRALQTELHRPWEDLPGQRSLFSVSSDVCLQRHVSPISGPLLPWQLALVPI